MKKRIISVVFCALLIISLIACGDKDDGGVTDTADSGVSAASETEETAQQYNIPESKNYNGETFTILAADGRTELYDAEQDGEVLNDVVYNRQLNTEEYFNIDIEYIHKESGWQVENEYVGIITSSILADEDAYDLINCPIVFACKILSDGYYRNTLDFDLDLSNPWWISEMKEKIGINNKLYMIAGDFSVTLYSTLTVAFFNKNLAENINLESPYDVVRNGKWTVEKMLDLMKDVASDLSGDGKIDRENDLLAFISHHTPFNSIQSSCEASVFEAKNGELVYNGISDRFVKLYDTIEPAFDRSDLFITDGTFEEDAKVFLEDRALFMFSGLRITTELRDMKSDYGILPFPKLNESDNYKIDVPVSSVQWVVPITAPNTELISDFCEYYAYYSYENVIPAYFEVTLKDKYSRDENTQEMLDVIRSARTLSIDSTFGYRFSPSPHNIVGILRSNLNPASHFAKFESGWIKQLDKFLETFK